MAHNILKYNQDYAGHCIQGKRNYQEDSFEFGNQENDFLMVLADGMGGHQGGKLASNCTVKAFVEAYYKSSGSVAKRLQQALQQSNEQIQEEVRKQPKLRGMGCTLVGVVIHNEQVEWISVGDSPLWLYSGGKLQRLNLDHSMKSILQAQVKIGRLTVKEAATHPDRNILLSALTGEKISLVDQSPKAVKLYSNDLILLASDGIFTLTDAKIAQVLSQTQPAKKLVLQLLEIVENKNRPTQDNTTAIVTKISNSFAPNKKNRIKSFFQFFKS